MKRFFNSFAKSTKSRSTSRRSSPRTLRFEQCEPRQMMTVSPILGGVVYNGPIVNTQPPPGPFAEGSINFDASTGVVSVDASQTHDDQINIYINHRAGNGAGNLPDLLTVSLANINTPQVAAFDPTLVTKIVVTCHAGNDLVDNRTSVPMNAIGGSGNDILLGGSGDDFLSAGTGNSYLDGRGGNNTLIGGPGTDVLFGGDGYCSLYAGSGTNYLFGGIGDDNLYGGSGHSRLEGEGGTNRIVDNFHTSTVYANWAPPSSVSTNGFAGFDFFDRALKDPAVRSKARLDYYLHNSLTRADMLDIYQIVETAGVESAVPFNGTVTANEVNDLKALGSLQLTIDPATRFLAGKIAYGDLANRNFQGAPLGNLMAGSTGSQLTKLVDKWFEGLDVPDVGRTGNATVNYQQMSGNLFAPGGPTFSDVAQGNLNDEALLAALGEEAWRSPQSIRNMFTDNGDGTYAVRFFNNGIANYVTVDRELPVSNGRNWFADWGGGQFDNGSNVLWVGLAEKALAQMNESGWIGSYVPGFNTYVGTLDLYAPYAMAEVTGNKASKTSVTTTFSDSQAAFWKAFNQHKAMTLTAKSSGTNSFILAGQEYMVVGFDAKTGRYELANPFGYDTDAAHPAVVWESWANIRHDFKDWTSAPA
jgi:Ca2+-binding RTX toxin-like protein